MFLPNLSLSIFRTFPFCLSAPCLLLKLLCWMCASRPSFPAASGKACARDSRLVINFFEARRRFAFFVCDFSIFETNAACLIARLSFFEEKRLRAGSLTLGQFAIVGEGIAATRDRIEGRF